MIQLKVQWKYDTFRIYFFEIPQIEIIFGILKDSSRELLGRAAREVQERAPGEVLGRA
jgi:hypothetical protein